MNKLAIFSDDGCDVTVDGVKVWSARDKGQALPDTDNSLHELPVTLSAGDHTVQIDYSNVIYIPADPSKGIPPDIDGCTLFVYGVPTPVVHVLTGSWQPNPAAVGQTITSAVTTQVDNPYQSPNGDSISEDWTWTTDSVYQSQDGTSGSFTAYEGSYAISWTQNNPATTFTGTFEDAGYYIIKVTATLTYHDDTTNTDVGTYSGDGYIGGSANDLAPPAANSPSSPSASAHVLSAHQTMKPMDAGTPVTTKGVRVVDTTVVGFKEVTPASGLDITLPNSTATPTQGHDVIIPVPGLIVPFDSGPNPYHGNINNVFVEINPKPSPNQIQFQPINSGAGAITVSPTILTYSASEYALLATGVKVGEIGGIDVIPTAAGSSVLAHLKVAVLQRKNVTVDFHFLSDTADATHPAHSTSRTAADIDAMLQTMNKIWNKQANVFFVKGTVDSVKYPSNLGDTVANTTIQNWGQKNYVAGQLNVYCVWKIDDGDGTVAGSTAWIGPGNNSVQLILIGDVFSSDNKARLAPSDEGKLLAHEAGHALGIVGDYLYDPDYLMTHDLSRQIPFQYTDDSWGLTWAARIHYDEAKTASTVSP